MRNGTVAESAILSRENRNIVVEQKDEEQGKEGEVAGKEKVMLPGEEHGKEREVSEVVAVTGKEEGGWEREFRRGSKGSEVAIQHERWLAINQL